jgi:hypothetical protein
VEKQTGVPIDETMSEPIVVNNPETLQAGDAARHRPVEHAARRDGTADGVDIVEVLASTSSVFVRWFIVSPATSG